MTDSGDTGDEGALPHELAAWVSDLAGGPVVAAHRHLGGASRTAWAVDVAGRDGVVELFLMRDPAGGSRLGGSGRDAVVLRALEKTPVPVPTVWGHDEGLGTLLLGRVAGRSDFPDVDPVADPELDRVAAHLMAMLSELHRLVPDELGLEGFARPATAEDHANGQLESSEALHAAVSPGADVLFAFALRWLRREIPTHVDRTTLVHGDMGPGNFLHDHGRVVALLDWEIAHLGDPMEDLAAVVVRDMGSARMGHLPQRLADYEAATGLAVDLDRVRYWRTLVLTRNSLALTASLAAAGPGADIAQMRMYQVLLMRAVAQSLCDAVGVDMPVEPAVDPGPPSPVSQLLDAAATTLDADVAPVVDDAYARHRLDGARDLVAAAAVTLRLGPALDARELDDQEALLGRRPTSVDDGHATLVELVAVAGAERDGELAAYLARRTQRAVARVGPLMGDRADRWLRPLEDPR